MTGKWERTAEFDAFGPWVMTVPAADKVPPLFRPVVDLTGARLAVKFPRPIERRDARPDMDLYDHLVLVREGGVEVLTRAPHAADGIQRTWLDGSDLLAAENSVALLDGRLRLHSRVGEPVEVTYNGSSAGQVEALLTEVRRFWREPAEARSGGEAGGVGQAAGGGRLDRAALGPKDIGLVAHFGDLGGADPALRPVVLRLRGTPQRLGSAPVRFLSRLFPTDLHAAVVGVTESELVVVHRRGWLLRRSQPAHSLATTVVPLRRGLHVERTDDPRWEGVRRVRLAPTSVTLVTTDDDGVEAAVRGLLA